MKLLRESSIFNKRISERRSVVGGLSNTNNWDIYRQARFDPHTEKEYCVAMFNRNSLANASVTTMRDFIIGGEVVVKSKDEESRLQVQQYLDDLNKDIWIPELVENAIKTGDGYLEFDFSDEFPDVVKKVYPIPDSSRIYINCDEYGEPKKETKLMSSPNGEMASQEVYNVDEYYIQKLDPQYEKVLGAKYYSLNYMFGSMFNQIQIFGVPIPMKNMLHIKFGLGDIGIYGRSVLASTIVDFEVLEQIERSLAIIAKHKAVPRDIITYGNEQNPATDDELTDFIIYLESLQKDQSAIINKPVTRETISYAGQDINLDYMIGHITKKLTAGIAPEFAIGMASDNKQTSQLTLLSYILSIYSKRKLILKPIEDRIIKPFVKAMGLQDCWLEFGELDFETKNEKTNRVGSLWTQNVITLNEARFQLGFPILEHGNTFFSNWQQTLLSNNDSDEDGVPDSFDNDFEGKEIEGSPGANTQQPNQNLSNNDSPDEVFNHRDAPNSKQVQKGGRMNFDVHRPTQKNTPKFLKKKKEDYNEIMDELKKLERTITITIDDEETQAQNTTNEGVVRVDFKTLMTTYSHIFNQPNMTEIYFKKLSDSEFTIKFKSNGVMVVCDFNSKDIIEHFDRDFGLSQQEEQDFVTAWINSHEKQFINIE